MYVAALASARFATRLAGFGMSVAIRVEQAGEARRELEVPLTACPLDGAPFSMTHFCEAGVWELRWSLDVPPLGTQLLLG